MEATQKEIVKSLVQMAWADGEIAPEEKTFLTQVLLTLGCTKEEIDTLNPAEIDMSPPALESVLVDRDSRRNTMRALLAMSFVDGTLSFSEFDYIQKIAKMLQLSDDDLEELRVEALAAAKAHSPS